MEKIILFDLENTIIPDFMEDRHTFLPHKFPELKNWIIDQLPFRAGLLSFAIDEQTLSVFNNELRSFIEETLLFVFDDSLIFTVEQMNDFINRENHTPWIDSQENISIFKKFGVTHQIWKKMFTKDDQHVILLDDTVEDMIIKRTSILPQIGGELTSTKPIKNNFLEFVNPWSIIRGI